jgi:hypothetical protein
MTCKTQRVIAAQPLPRTRPVIGRTPPVGNNDHWCAKTETCGQQLFGMMGLTMWASHEPISF